MHWQQILCNVLGTATINTGYVRVVIEIVGRNHPPEFPNCATYSSDAEAPETTEGAFVVQVRLIHLFLGSHLWVNL